MITDPAVIADMKRFVKLNKEYRDLEKIVAARAEYIKALNGIEEAKALLDSEQDPEMREMAREELDSCNERIPALEEEIKLLLVPADPQDDKNAIVEIRGGTGGDEAALFAGDLYRMYVKYCEMKGWKVSVSSFSEGSSGGFKEIIFTVSGENLDGRTMYLGFYSSQDTSTKITPVNTSRFNANNHVQFTGTNYIGIQYADVFDAGTHYFHLGVSLNDNDTNVVFSEMMEYWNQPGGVTP